MIRRVRRPVHRRAIDTGEDTADEEAWDILCGLGDVAHHAGVITFELWYPGFRLAECVEDRALLGILRNDFEHRPAAYPSDRDRVVEEDGARIVRVDSRRLETRLGEDEDLRIDWHLQRRQHRRQISGRSLLLE
jgi:hypothetical protein